MGESAASKKASQSEKMTGQGSEDHGHSQNAVNSEFEENSNQIPDNMHNI
jgi:hypothetical protein